VTARRRDASVRARAAALPADDWIAVHGPGLACVLAFVALACLTGADGATEGAGVGAIVGAVLTWLATWRAQQTAAERARERAQEGAYAALGATVTQLRAEVDAAHADVTQLRADLTAARQREEILAQDLEQAERRAERRISRLLDAAQSWSPSSPVDLAALDLPSDPDDG
jgi:septal ring factor EnvC (AmiA/AmiB activator)